MHQTAFLTLMLLGQLPKEFNFSLAFVQKLGHCSLAVEGWNRQRNRTEVVEADGFAHASLGGQADALAGFGGREPVAKEIAVEGWFHLKNHVHGAEHAVRPAVKFE